MGKRARTVPSRELRNNTRQLLDEVAIGTELTITIDGRPVAVLGPVPQPRRPLFMPTAELLRLLPTPDPSFAADLRALVGDETTDDIEVR
jgi:prevent-host-death family protein